MKKVFSVFALGFFVSLMSLVAGGFNLAIVDIKQVKEQCLVLESSLNTWRATENQLKLDGHGFNSPEWCAAYNAFLQTYNPLEKSVDKKMREIVLSMGYTSMVDSAEIKSQIEILDPTADISVQIAERLNAEMAAMTQESQTDSLR